MRPFGHALGKLQKPVVIFDTSALVKMGQRDAGAIAAYSELGAILQERTSDTPPFNEVAFHSAVTEYMGLYEHHVLDEFGRPKASSEIVTLLPDNAFPTELRDRLGDATELWRHFSRKAQNAPIYGRFGALDLADKEIIAYALEQADNDRECYVFSYDEDIIGAVNGIDRHKDKIHLVTDRLLRPKFFEGNLSEGVVLIPADLAGKLYSMPSFEKPSHYIVTAKAPVAGGKFRIAVSIHPIEDRLSFHEGDAYRHVLWIDDAEYVSMKGHQSNMEESRAAAKAKRFNVELTRRYGSGSFSLLCISKARSKGVMEVDFVDNNVTFKNGRLEKERVKIPADWFSFDPYYFGRFSPETNRYLYDFSRRYPK